jgi:type I site-specific restriction endonuclease
MPAEAKARIRINELLSKSGWRFFADENGPANVQLEAHVKLTKKTLDELGNDFEKTSHGYVDYLLLDQRGFPIAVLEAKSEKFEPLVGKEQARKYARSQKKRVITTGLLDKSPVHPREVFADVIADRAASVIFAHNHPSGDLQSSEADLRLQEQLTEAGKILGISVLDHIIVAKKGYYSFQEAGLIQG